MVTTTPQKTSELFRLAHSPTLEGLHHQGNQLLTTMKRFMAALEDIAALPCASDLPLCHNPGCASCRAKRALAGPVPGSDVLSACDAASAISG